MKIELRPSTFNTPAPTTETGRIDGLDAQVNTFPNSVAVTIQAWSPIRSVGCHRPTRDEAIAEAVRMARACGMIGE